MRWVVNGEANASPSLGSSGQMWSAKTWEKAPARSNQRAYALRKERMSTDGSLFE